MQADNTILISTGQSISLRAPDYTQLTVTGIAHSLAQINRFTGHSHRPYSVAEHSLLVSEIITQHGGGTLAQLAGLMHDAHEALVGDCTSPLKAEMRRMAAAQTFESDTLPVARTWSHFDRAEAAAEAAVRMAFGLLNLSSAYKGLVHAADMTALATERRDLLPASPEAWPCLHGVSPVRTIDLLSSERCAYSWADWRDAFIERYAELDHARKAFERSHNFGGKRAA